MTKTIVNSLYASLMKEAVNELPLIKAARGQIDDRIKPFYPNPGSQSNLIFDLLNCERGNEKIVDYGNGETESTYEVVPKQYEGDRRFICYTAGNGTGKSKIGAFFCVLRTITNPGARGLITANDYTQLASSTLIALAEFCLEYNVKLKPQRATPEDTAASIAYLKRCHINDVHHYVLSANAFLGETKKAKQAGRGFTIGHVWADEWLRLHSPSAFSTVLTRLRDKSCKPLGLITSTINTDNPYGWDYELFDDPDRNAEAKRLFISVTGTTFENRHNLSSDYISTLKATLTPELYQIEVLGQRVRMTVGRIAKYFNRDRHFLRLSFDPTKALHLSCDFNRHPATTIAAQFDEDEKEIRVIKEFYLLNSDTFELGNALARWLTEIDLKTALYLHGDATGNSSTANSKQSNWQIIRNALQPWNPIRRYGQANPANVDAINSLNAAFSHDQVYLDIDSKELAKDLETLKYDDKGQIDKKNDLMRSHLFDCLKYLIHDLLPLLRPAVKNVVSQAVW